MLLSTTQEFRLYAPNHAYDDITPLLGTMAISEADFLAPVLGNSLYDTLCSAYMSKLQDPYAVDQFVSDIQQLGDGALPHVDQLIHLSQRCIVYDTLSRVADMQTLSIHASGINISTADDYKAPEAELVRSYKAQASREAHASLNILLQRLEGWAKAGESMPLAQLWRDDSRYYYLAARLIFPSAVVLNDYLPNFYENRERFIQLIPDIRAVQEDILAPAIGEEVMDYFISVAEPDDVTGHTFFDQTSPTSSFDIAALHRLRKAAARLLEERILRNKPRQASGSAAITLHQATINQSHQEAIALIESFLSFMQRRYKAWQDLCQQPSTTSSSLSSQSTHSLLSSLDGDSSPSSSPSSTAIDGDSSSSSTPSASSSSDALPSLPPCPLTSSLLQALALSPHADRFAPSTPSITKSSPSQCMCRPNRSSLFALPIMH